MRGVAVVREQLTPASRLRDRVGPPRRERRRVARGRVVPPAVGRVCRMSDVRDRVTLEKAPRGVDVATDRGQAVVGAVRKLLEQLDVRADVDRPAVYLCELRVQRGDVGVQRTDLFLEL